MSRIEVFEIVGKNFSREYDVNGIRDFLTKFDNPLIDLHTFNPDYEMHSSLLETGGVPYSLWLNKDVFFAIDEKIYSDLTRFFRDEFGSYDKIRESYEKLLESSMSRASRDESGRIVFSLDKEFENFMRGHPLATELGQAYITTQASLKNSKFDLHVYDRPREIYQEISKKDYGAFDCGSFNDYLFKEYGIF